ncbi:TetR/AcrR family transcriptional regulator [Cypionkella sp.]|uniref:TetR/AcrR family transcriptional regulator n=1 Tax=Cypionkella sp. TaxID=2811411 RepID=UPI00260AC423|nr:TetR/AcrR family transcriptional regulator [Cypionkella sp.]
MAGGLFYSEGIRAVGIDRIIRESDIAKATLYRHYRSKEDLVLAYLRERHIAVMAGLDEVLALHTAPRDQIAEIFERLYQKAGNPNFRGCAFGLAVAEHGASARIVGLARMHKTAVADELNSIALRAGLVEADQIGRHLALLYDGALARRAVYGNVVPMRDAKECALALFDHAARNELMGKIGI